MAQLSHPNVVQIHDVGEHDGELFLTMELIRGATLDVWLAELGPARVRATRWREIVATFVEAGRGIAAAHAAGLVHRDFKPSNVLVGDIGTKVSDFGLARGEHEEGESESGQSDEVPSRALHERMTETGALIGTPAYLAPEQLGARRATAASDQFSFCVALYEALLGERPFVGEDLRTLAASLLAGRRRPLPEAHAIPSWLLAVIDRGLAVEPSDRWPSMDALLDALLDDPARRRRRRLALGVLAVACVGIAAAFGGHELHERGRCEALGQDIDVIWNPQTRERLAAAFERSGAPEAASTWARVEPQIDAWTKTWRDARTSACHEAREQPERGHRRETCLDRERWQLEALLDVFAAADRATVIEAVMAVADLPALERCEAATWLAADVSLQVEPELEQRSVELRRELARVFALERAGRHAEALALAQRSVDAAEQLDDPLVQSEALAKLGGIRYRVADFAGAEQALLAGHFLAGRVEHARVGYATARDLAWVVGVRLARPDEGRVWLEHARMNLARMGEDPEREPEVFVMLGELEDADGSPQAALLAHERALALREQTLGLEHPEIADSLINIGRIQTTLGDARALATLERGRELAIASLGLEHPVVATADNELGVLLVRLGRVDEGVAAYRRAAATRERAMGPSDPGLAMTLSNLAAALNGQGQLLESLLLLERAVAILEQALGPEHPDTLAATINFAVAKAEFGEIDVALDLLRRTLARAERVLGRDDAMVGAVLANIAYWLEQRGDHSGALPLRVRVLAIDEALLGSDHLEVAADLDALARSYAGVGELEQAEASRARALAIREAAD